MSGFVRPAPWLRRLFTPSQTAPVNPTMIGDEVSLVQPYDGSGWPLQDPGQWHGQVDSAVAALGQTTLFELNSDEIGRLLCLGGLLLAGVAADIHFNVVDPITGFAASLTSKVNTAGTVIEACEIYSPIIGPGHRLTGVWSGGGAATQITWRWYVVRAPIGTVFYI